MLVSRPFLLFLRELHPSVVAVPAKGVLKCASAPHVVWGQFTRNLNDIIFFCGSERVKRVFVFMALKLLYPLKTVLSRLSCPKDGAGGYLSTSRRGDHTLKYRATIRHAQSPVMARSNPFPDRLQRVNRMNAPQALARIGCSSQLYGSRSLTLGRALTAAWCSNSPGR